MNAVAPGFIETRLTAAKQEGEDVGIPEQVRAMALMLIGLGQYGEPEDVANAHLYLASSEADLRLRRRAAGFRRPARGVGEA